MKKLLLILLALTMLISLVACGNDGEGDDKDNKNDNGSIFGDNGDNDDKDDGKKEDEKKPVVEADGTINLDEPLVLVKSSVNEHAYSYYIYDENGNITNELTFHNNKQSHNYEYTYEDLGDGTTRVRVMDMTAEGFGTEYFYNEYGMCIKEVRYDVISTKPERVFAEDKISAIREYTYDATGKILSYTYAGKDGIAVEIITYSYDENGRFIGVSTTDIESGAVLTSDTYTRDENGDIIGRVRVNGGNTYELTFKPETVVYGGVVESKQLIEAERGGKAYQILYNYDSNGALNNVTVNDKQNLGFYPPEMFLGDGALMRDCETTDCVFKPLSVALAEQAELMQ